MDRVQSVVESGFKILCIMAAVDRQVTAEEIRNMAAFFQMAHGVSPDQKQLETVVRTFASMTTTQMVQEIFAAADAYKSASTEQERINLVDWALNSILSDGTFSPEEQTFYSWLKVHLDIKGPTLLESALAACCRQFSTELGTRARRLAMECELHQQQSPHVEILVETGRKIVPRGLFPTSILDALRRYLESAM